MSTRGITRKDIWKKERVLAQFCQFSRSRAEGRSVVSRYRTTTKREKKEENNSGRHCCPETGRSLARRGQTTVLNRRRLPPWRDPMMGSQTRLVPSSRSSSAPLFRSSSRLPLERDQRAQQMSDSKRSTTSLLEPVVASSTTTREIDEEDLRRREGET